LQSHIQTSIMPYEPISETTVKPSYVGNGVRTCA
jgi:hypothetical protein